MVKIGAVAYLAHPEEWRFPDPLEPTLTDHPEGGDHPGDADGQHELEIDDVGFFAPEDLSEGTGVLVRIDAIRGYRETDGEITVEHGGNKCDSGDAGHDGKPFRDGLFFKQEHGG